MMFLFQSPHAWRGVWQRPHHLAVQFARAGHSVRWVEPRYLRWLLDEPARFLRARREMPSERIEVIPATLVNGERFAPIRRMNERRLARLLDAPLAAPVAGKRILWLYHPHEAHLARTVPHDLLVYDIMDEFRGFPWSPPGIEAEEAELLKSANLVFAGTHALLESKRAAAGSKIECELSGVDIEHFSAGRGKPVPVDLAPLRSKYKRLLGYAGMIDLRVDQDLLVAGARSHPDWGWILLGPEAADTSRLRNEPNIHLLGQKAYADLPAYYAASDAAIIPFVENELTRHINPTKILEYAAAGLPVITVALPDVERFYADGAFLYRTPDEFETCLQRVFADDAKSPEVLKKIEASRIWSRERSWEAIASRMLARISSFGA